MMRPWFFSFTAILKESESKGWSAFQDEAGHVLEQIPFHHVRVLPDYWHFTVFVLAKYQVEPPPKPIEKHMVSLFQQISEKILTPMDFKLKVVLKKFTCYDSGTCPQFEACDDVLTRMRWHLRVSLFGVVKLLQALSPGIHPTLDDSKNVGNNAYGSIARSLAKTDAAVERWTRSVQSPIELEFKKIHFVVSDEFLTNPAAFRDTERKTIWLDGKPSESSNGIS